MATYLALYFSLLLQQEKPGGPDAQKQDPKVQDRLDDQEERIRDLEKKLQEIEQKQTQSVSANPLTVLNPTVTVVGDFLGRYDRMKVFTESGANHIDDTMNLREMELDFRSAVDPYVSAVGILSISSEVPGTYTVDVEEFYAVIKSLPIPLWENPPLGTQIKIGRFRTDFGLNNKSHTHDLPQSDRPLVMDQFLSPDGHGANGVSLTSFLPSPGDSALQLTAQVLQGGGIGIAQDPNHLAYLASLNCFVPISDEHNLNVSLIGFHGINDPFGHDESEVVSLDLLYRWKPLRQGEYNSFLLGAQLFYANHEFPDAANAAIRDHTHPFGYTMFLQYQFTSRVYGGVRWDDTDLLAVKDEREKQVVPYITWYSSEFFRFRINYEHTWSKNTVGTIAAPGNGQDSVLFELVIVFGSHPNEPFWVNK